MLSQDVNNNDRKKWVKSLNKTFKKSKTRQLLIENNKSIINFNGAELIITQDKNIVSVECSRNEKIGFKDYLNFSEILQIMRG